MSILVHIGYHKTATTWMQRRLFTPECGYQQILSHDEVWGYLLAPHGLSFDPTVLRELIKERTAALDANLTPVISSELICGHPFFGGVDSDVYANRLSEVLPDAKILVTIRSQNSMLSSVYMQYVRRGGTQTPAKFFQPETALGYPAFDLSHFEYDRLVRHYIRLFDNVRIQTHESLSTEYDQALRQLSKFSGQPVFRSPQRSREGISAAQSMVGVLRRANHFRSSPLNPCPLLPIGTEHKSLYQIMEKLGGALARHTFLKKHRPVSNYVQKHFSTHYCASNKRLAAIAPSPLDLSDYP